jgi:hypothetical protein
VAAGDQRLLVGRGYDLAGAQRGEYRTEAHDAARRDDHDVDVLPRRQLDEGVVARRPFRAGREIQACEGIRIGKGHHVRSEPSGLIREHRAIVSGGERHDPEVVRVRRQDVDRLGPDRAGRSQERGTAALRQGARRHRAS